MIDPVRYQLILTLRDEFLHKYFKNSEHRGWHTFYCDDSITWDGNNFKM